MDKCTHYKSEWWSRSVVVHVYTNQWLHIDSPHFKCNGKNNKSTHAFKAIQAKHLRKVWNNFYNYFMRMWWPVVRVRDFVEPNSNFSCRFKFKWLFRIFSLFSIAFSCPFTFICVFSTCDPIIHAMAIKSHHIFWRKLFFVPEFMRQLNGSLLYAQHATLLSKRIRNQSSQWSFISVRLVLSSLAWVDHFSSVCTLLFGAFKFWW